MTSKARVVLAICLGFACAPAWAGPVSFSLVGTVETALDGNAFGLGVGDTIHASGVFDDVATGSGAEAIFFNQGSGNTLDILVGSVFYDETDDAEYTGAFPQLTFLDGLLTSLNFSSQLPPKPEFFGTVRFAGDRVFPGADCFTDTTNCGITGTWDLGSFATVPISSPGTLALLAIGLVAALRPRKAAMPPAAHGPCRRCACA